jgi:hypothetical protein
VFVFEFDLKLLRSIKVGHPKVGRERVNENEGVSSQDTSPTTVWWQISERQNSERFLANEKQRKNN